MRDPNLGIALVYLEKRGGVVVEVDGRAHEIRAELHDDGFGERMFVSLDSLRLLARMDKVVS